MDDRTWCEGGTAMKDDEPRPAIDSAIENALSGLSENTRRAYSQQYNRWRRFANQLGLQLYPVKQDDLHTYVTSIESKQIRTQAKTAIHRLNRAKDGPITVRLGRIAGQEAHCSKCGGAGHNSRGCFVGAIPATGLKGRRGRGVQIVVTSGAMKSTFDADSVEFGDAVAAVTDFLNGLGRRRYYTSPG